MSEPWIRFYASDFRGDQKLAGMNEARRLALLHAWDIAKNGPGDPTELRDAKGAKLTESELRRMAEVNPQATRKLYADWADRGLCIVAEDGLVRFPKLARRQGIDPTNRDRQARHRAKTAPPAPPPRNGKVTPEVTPPVTAGNEPDFVGEEGESNGEVTDHARARSRSQKEPPGSSAPPSSLRSEGSAPLPAARCAAQQEAEPGFAITPAGTRRCDELWEALTDELDIDTAELTKPARGSLNAAVKALRDVGATPGDVHVRCARYRRQMGVALTAPALAKHWAALARDRAAVVRSPDARRDRAAEIAAMGERRIS